MLVSVGDTRFLILVRDLLSFTGRSLQRVASPERYNYASFPLEAYPSAQFVILIYRLKWNIDIIYSIADNSETQISVKYYARCMVF